MVVLPWPLKQAPHLLITAYTYTYCEPLALPSKSLLTTHYSPPSQAQYCGDGYVEVDIDVEVSNPNSNSNHNPNPNPDPNPNPCTTLTLSNPNQVSAMAKHILGVVRPLDTNPGPSPEPEPNLNPNLDPNPNPNVNPT